MASSHSNTFVGFGFGAIQAGLFLYEASRSGNFGRLVVAEVVPEIVAAVRAAGGVYSVNVAHADHVQHAQIGAIEIYDPADAAGRERLIDAVAEARELATAVPSVDLYATPGEGSIHRLLAAGLTRKTEQGGPLAVVYTAENHNRAAEILSEHVLAAIDEDRRQAVRTKVRFLNTVIGKMSGVVAQAKRRGLAPITPTSDRAFLVEAFNRILISRVTFAEPFSRGIEVFEEKGDLLPFEEAKLFGHNATHALAAYLGRLLGVARVAQLRDVPGFIGFLRDAFIEESGAALIRRHAGVDRLFTPAGYAAYADDLLARMTNPFLLDTIERVGRDPGRKLAWDDRLVGTMRMALAEGIRPRRFGIGAAAAVAALNETFLDAEAPVVQWVGPLWESADPGLAERDAVTGLIESGRAFLRQWRAEGMPDLQVLFAACGRGE